VARLSGDGNRPAAVARALGVSRMSVYRMLRECRQSGDDTDDGQGTRTGRSRMAPGRRSRQARRHSR
jgi:transposase